MMIDVIIISNDMERWACLLDYIIMLFHGIFMLLNEVVKLCNGIVEGACLLMA